MALKNIIFITDDCSFSGGGPKVPLFEVNYLCNYYNVILFCGFITDSERFDKRIKIISVRDTSYFGAKNKLRGALLGLNDKKAKRMLKELLKDYSPEDTVIHIHGFVSALSSSIFKPVYKSKIQCFYTLHAYHMVCPNGGFFNFNKCEICKLKPGSMKCRRTNCDSRSKLFKIYRMVRQRFQNRNVKLGKNGIHYIFLSKVSYDALIGYLKPTAEYRFIPNPVETRDNKVSNIKDNDYYLFVGRLAKEKGVVQLCEYADRKGIKLVLVGDGALSEELKEKYKNNEKLIFDGWQKFDHINERMMGARALIFPSLWYECQPLTVLEAKGAGLPTVVSSLCASKDDITEESGILIDPYSYEDFSNAIDVLDNDDVLAQMSKAALSEFEAYTKRSHYDLLVDFYKAVLPTESDQTI